ncbi:MAG: GDSL-type esterase/lipase family protein [Acetobacteraceae bacterium]
MDGAHIAVVNEGIADNQVLGPAEYAPDHAFAGGPSAGSRLDRDVLSLSGVTDVIWLEGINDLATGAMPDAVRNGMQAVVDRIRAKIKGVKVFGATLTSSRASALPGYGTVDTDEHRHALNDLLRKPGLFDAVIDFDAATVDPQTGEMRPEFVPPSTFGGAGDKLHPNRPGYVAMGDAVELGLLAPAPPERPRPRPRPRPAPADAGDTASTPASPAQE